MKTVSRIGAGKRPARLVPAVLAAVCVMASPASQVLLVEAESFDDLGGWQVDTQSVEQMGSVYLIAHGLGKPVADARHSVALPAAGDYRVWVRTRNWVPGNWQPPGRFKVAINGGLLAPEFGTQDAGWHWQDGGTVALGGPAAEIALKDLSGFNGRCDAIALIAGSDEPPPGGAAALKAWRRTVKNEAAGPEDVRRFDCVVAGGGIAGCCAALAAARSGLQVALIQDRPVLGGNASREIRVATRGEIRHPIVDEIDTLSLGNRDDRTIGADDNRLAVISREPNLTLFMPWRAEDAGTDPATRRITHIDARHTLGGRRARLQADFFIDCTGDAWIGYWAGASYRMGWEAKSEFGESLGMDSASAMTMGNSLMWKSKTGAADSTFPAVPWAMDVAGTRADTGGEWNWEYGMTKDTIEDAEHIRDHLLRAIFGNFSNAKKSSANAKLELDWVPFIAGKRESRRLMGDHILTQNDMVNGVFFEDAVGTTDWGIDLHYETSTSYLSTYKKTNIAKPGYFPFRSLYSRDVPNLLMAGRNFSCTHAGLGSPRVMNTTGQMGVAAGYAVAICRQYGITPRDLYRSHERTTELQARITGAWPARPAAAGYTLDNGDATGVDIHGAWTASTGVPGFIGADYLYAAAGTPGSHRVAYTPPSLIPGSYEIALRWTQQANRNPQTPVWVFNSAPAAHDAGGAELQSIRVTRPTEAQTTGSLEVGRYAANDYQRGLLRFDLAGLPAGAVVRSAEVVLTSPGADAGSGTGFAGAEGLRLDLLGEAYVHGQAGWTRRDAATAWTTPGGTIDTAAGAMGVLVTGLTDPNLVAPGETFTLGSTALGAAVRRAHKLGAPLALVLRTPSLESSYAVRKIYRFSSAVLRVSAWLPRLPATCTVDQRANGGQWNSIGSHLVGQHGITVVIGNDGAAGTYSPWPTAWRSPPPGAIRTAMATACPIGGNAGISCRKPPPRLPPTATATATPTIWNTSPAATRTAGPRSSTRRRPSTRRRALACCAGRAPRASATASKRPPTAKPGISSSKTSPPRRRTTNTTRRSPAAAGFSAWRWSERMGRRFALARWHRRS
jgi:hypothetical protein